MVDMEFHYTSLQCGRIELGSMHLFAMLPGIHCGVYTFKHCTMKANLVCHHADIHSTLESKMKGRSVVKESSQVFLMLKCNMKHYVE